MIQIYLLQISILVLGFTPVQSIIEVGYYFHPGRQYGEYSDKITSEPQLSDIMNDFYVCGLGLYETNWIAKISNCRCRNSLRCIQPGRCIRCQLCDNQLWTQVNSIKVQYCHKNEWKNQKTQVFYTGKPNIRNLRMISCPQNQYASGIRIRLGTQYSVDIGLVGVQLRCEDIKHKQQTFVQDNYNHPLSQISQNPKNTFITSFQFKYVKNDKIVGLKAYFGQDIKPLNAIIEYGQVNLNGSAKIISIEQVVKENRELVSIPYTIQFKNSYNVSNTWINDAPQMNKYQLPQGIEFSPPILSNTKLTQNPYYSSKSTPFKFQVSLIKTYTSSKTVPTLIPWCNSLKMVSQVEEQRASAPYTITLKYVSPSTGEIITRTITGTWAGFVYKPIQTDISNTQIHGCKSD